MPSELTAFQNLLRTSGLHAALGMLNNRTPHRYTGVYRYDGDMLRNVALFDRFALEVVRGDDVPLENAYCSVFRKAAGDVLEFDDARTDGRFAWIAGSPVVCYCGVMIRDAQGAPFATLCHYDTQRCQMRVSDLPLLTAVAPMILEALLQPLSAAR